MFFKDFDKRFLEHSWGFLPKYLSPWENLQSEKSQRPWKGFNLWKLVSAIFCYQFFIFHQMIRSLFHSFEKCFLFHLKSSFRSWDIQIFVFLSFPLFFPVTHGFRGWSKKNLKVYDVINSLHKNLITHFVWYLAKEISRDIGTLSIDRVLNKGHFYGEILLKMCTKS